jgi:trehalose 6-phosphate synthase/phosphatase
MAEGISPKRLVIVSNRLPFNVMVENGTLRFKESAGGLVSSMETFLASFSTRQRMPDDYLWVGWPGNTVEENLRGALRQEALRRFRSHPVFLSEEEMDRFYNGFCNKTIWPLFHYFPSYTSYQEEHWKSYLRVNEIFCEGLQEILREDDLVWVHDYHLMLLPKLLRDRGFSVPIGFFLHIPFPSYDVFRLVPVAWRREMLEGLLGADLIGFHTFEYSQNFLQSALRMLGYEHNLGQISLQTHVVKVETFPLGIDFEKFFNAASTPDVLEERKNFVASLAQSRVVLSVDRLDYSKGILNRLEGYELLLERYPALRGKVVLIMVVVPSRVMVDQYEIMKKQIEEQVGKINGKFGAVGWTPIVYQYRSLPFHSLVALYSISDVALVTPLRDGMNLVAKEYIASRTDGTGVLVLSEMAGAAKELGEAIIVNPNYREELAGALNEALEMPVEEQKRRNHFMQARLRRYNVVRWADEFIDRLGEMKVVQEKFLAKLLPNSVRQKLLQDYKRCAKRLILLDYDGTLVPLERHPHIAKPGKDLIALLQTMTDDKKNTVILISGRDKETLRHWFGPLNINIVAEHGVWIRECESGWVLLKQQTNDWKPSVLPIMQMHADRLPGSFVEEKDYSLAWHYRAADPEQAQTIVGELADNLVNFIATIDLQVLRGNKVIEVRRAGINKGTAAMHWLARNNHDFVLAIGDDVTDEDLFSALPENSYSIRVGVANTLAHFNVRDSREVIRLLESLVKS